MQFIDFQHLNCLSGSFISNLNIRIRFHKHDFYFKGKIIG